MVSKLKIKVDKRSTYNILTLTFPGGEETQMNIQDNGEVYCRSKDGFYHKVRDENGRLASEKSRLFIEN